MNNPTDIYAVQHVRKMRGGAQAHLLRASDGNFYVTKFQNNPQSIRILANEYLATKLGQSLGLPMPEARVIEVSDWLIQNTPELKIDQGTRPVPCASGLQFGSRYVADPLEAIVFDYLPEAMLTRIANWRDFPRVLVFDKWTGNSDGRQAVFVKERTERRYRAVFIDQGYCFNAGEWNFSDSPLRGAFARNSVYERVTGWEDFEPTLSRIEQLDVEYLWKIAAEIPEEWYEHDSGSLMWLIEALHARRTRIQEFVTSFRNSTRRPFPNWTDKQDRPAKPKPPPQSR
jgi:HipA-like kinase